jgi:murein L,D-transpeptidase YcbB/YkuD
VRGEILPALRRDPGYLQRHDMELVAGPGDDARVVPASGENITLLRQGVLRVRQRPGPANSLGLVKFVFPNDANVYMHDTPARQLFSRTRRDFSHGCIRLEDPAALAQWALQDQPAWSRERIDAAMHGRNTTRVNLSRPVKVVLFYVTATVGRDGSVRFTEDIYGHDATLDRALAAAH